MEINFKFFVIILFGAFLIFNEGCKKLPSGPAEKPNYNGINSNVPVPATVTDFDGNVYHTIKIGSAAWLQENLKVTHFNDGTPITVCTNNEEWRNTSSLNSLYGFNDNQTTKKDTFGLIYNFGAASNIRNICPVGWHVPTDAEWAGLEIYLQNNGYNFDGVNDVDYLTSTKNNIAKSMTTTTLWDSSNVAGSVGNLDFPDYRNKSGFSAPPGGMRNFDGSFAKTGFSAYYWSSSSVNGNFYNAWVRAIYNSNSGTSRLSFDKFAGMSVRCIRDL